MTYRTIWDRLKFGDVETRRNAIKELKQHKGKVPLPLCSINRMTVGTLTWFYCVQLKTWMPPGKFDRECKKCQIKIEELIRDKT